MKIKALFFDIDGTLISLDTHQVPLSTLQALRKVKEKGIKIFVATGRHLSAIKGLNEIDFDGYITLNGAYCVDKEKHLLFKKSIPYEDIEGLVRLQKETHSFPCVFVEENQMCINEVDERVLFLYGLLQINSLPIRDLDYFREREVFQVTAFFYQEEEEEIMKSMPFSSGMRWHPSFTDIIAAGVDKAMGIDQICAHYGFSKEETMVFGDGGNDISMIRHAGIGIAMGNAGDEVKQSADYVTDPIDEDGVEKALLHFGIIEPTVK